MNAAVQMNHITKKFGKLYANRDVSLTVERNSIHGIVGENGAGKTTLMKILYGMHPAGLRQEEILQTYDCLSF